jgi:hypothetical protein
MVVPVVPAVRRKGACWDPCLSVMHAAVRHFCSIRIDVLNGSNWLRQTPRQTLTSVACLTLQTTHMLVPCMRPTLTAACLHVAQTVPHSLPAGQSSLLHHRSRHPHLQSLRCVRSCCLRNKILS